MKKILGLTVAALMVMGLVGGGTWAYFSDPESTANNVFTAGKLDISLSGASSVPFSETNFVCGQTMSGSIDIDGTGNSINTTLALTTGAFTEPGGESQPLEFNVNKSAADVAGELTITVTVPDGELIESEYGVDLIPWTADDAEDGDSDPDVIYTGAVSGLNAGADNCSMTIADTITYTITVTFPADPTGTDNDWQGDGVEFDFTWTAYQLQ
ncbi:TasA family protein [Chloroflexota bacterium]